MEERRMSQKIGDESAEVELTIDSYMDIFSGFDPRPFSDRGFSEDFLFETERAVMSKNSDKINFVITIQEDKRNSKEETTIKNRLKKYFTKYKDILKKERKKVLKKGISFTLVGIILMFIVTYLYFKFRQETFLTSFFVILLEPGSWLLFWEGLDLIIFEAKKTAPNIKFYERMVNANISFSSYK